MSANSPQHTIKIYEKSNLHPISGNWVLKDQYDAGESGTLYNNPKTIDIAANEYGLHIVYGFTDSYGGASSSNVYYLNYKINEGRWAGFSGGPRVRLTPLGNGNCRPTLSLSEKNNVRRVHVVYTAGIRTRDIRFNSYDDITLENQIATNYWGTGRSGAAYTNYEWGKLITDPRANGKLFLIASPAYLSGQIRVDSRLKSRDIETQAWTSNAGILNQYDYIGHFFPQSAFYDAYIENRIPVCYGYVTGTGLDERTDIEYKEFNIVNDNFDHLSRRILFDQALSGGASYGPCIMKADSQGVYVTAFRGSNPSAMEMKRKPRDYRNDIKYNALWSGFVYINAPISPFCRTAGADVEAMNASTIRLKQGTNVLVDPNDYIRFRQGSCVIFEPDAEIFEAGGHVYYETNCITWNYPTCNSAYNGGSIKIAADLGTFTVNNGGFLVIDDGSTLEVGSNTKLVIDGSQSWLKVKPGSTVKIGQGSSIEVKNGAWLDADGCTFTSINPNEIWNGIFLDGAGSQTVIKNCTFNDAAKSIYVKNTVCLIQSNTINVPSNTSGIYGIEAIDETNITVHSNTINMGSNNNSIGIRFFTYDGDVLPGGGGGSLYSLNIVNNYINGGALGMELTCVTASQLPFLVSANQITPASGSTIIGIFAYNITGNIKQNVFSNFNSTKALYLQFCNVNLFDNTFKSYSQSIYLSSSSTVQMAPIQNPQGQWVWIGGYNKLTSGVSYNIEFTLGSNSILSPKGYNCFTVNTQPNDRIKGEFCQGPKPFHSYDNYWYPANPTFDITCNNNPVIVNYLPVLSTCPIIDPDDFVGYDVTDCGNGIYDTVFITSGGEGGSYNNLSQKTSNTDVTLYYEALTKRKNRDFAAAINKCKELVDNHDTSKYFLSALSELYLDYLESDSIRNQNITAGLFSNLKSYLEQKIVLYSPNSQFVERAYKYFLMCLVKMRNYSEAIAGYENIMNNHPDPIARINASWDRSAVILLMGQGGGENQKDNTTKAKHEKKLLDKNPAHKIAKDIFEKSPSEFRSERDNNSEQTTPIYSREEKAELNRRIEKFNPSNAFDLQSKVSSDIRVISVIEGRKRSGKGTDQNVPKSFKLYQNHPNPFNPHTFIKYDLPKDALITIKVYDILGKQIFGMEEFKKSGSYEVRFDGSGIASGMYFYIFETNGFKDTKKMVLIK